MGGLRAHADQPVMFWSEAALLVATPALLSVDYRTQAEATEGRLSHDNVTTSGNQVAVGLSVFAVGLGGTELWNGDGGQSAEVLLESFLVVQGVTEVLKTAVGRNRPDGGSPNSFPSGHSSYAFSLATYCARTLDDCTDEWYGKLGYLAFAPATYIAYNRTEGNRHYSSDCTFGAFLGMALTNLIYDAHFGGPDRPGIFRQGRVRVSFEPVLDDEGSRFDVVVRF